MHFTVHRRLFIVPACACWLLPTGPPTRTSTDIPYNTHPSVPASSGRAAASCHLSPCCHRQRGVHCSLPDISYLATLTCESENETSLWNVIGGELYIADLSAKSFRFGSACCRVPRAAVFRSARIRGAHSGLCAYPRTSRITRAGGLRHLYNHWRRPTRRALGFLSKVVRKTAAEENTLFGSLSGIWWRPRNPGKSCFLPDRASHAGRAWAL